LIAALQVLASIVETGRRASEVGRLFAPVPQLSRSVRFGEGDPLESPGVKRVVHDGQARLGVEGRLVIRKSGTEPVIRVMAESEDEVLVATVVKDICTAIHAVAAGTGSDQPASPRLGLIPAQAAE
jgi:phosphoglucosamine mutase